MKILISLNIVCFSVLFHAIPLIQNYSSYSIHEAKITLDHLYKPDSIEIPRVTIKQTLQCRQTHGGAEVPCIQDCYLNGFVRIGLPETPIQYNLNFQPGQNDDNVMFQYSNFDNSTLGLSLTETGKVNGFDITHGDDGREIYGTRSVSIFLRVPDFKKKEISLNYDFNKEVEVTGTKGISTFDLEYSVTFFMNNQQIENPEIIRNGNGLLIFQLKGKGEYRVDITSTQLSAKVINYGSPRNFSSSLKMNIEAK